MGAPILTPHPPYYIDYQLTPRLTINIHSVTATPFILRHSLVSCTHLDIPLKWYGYP